MRVLTRRRIAAKDMAEELGLLARLFRALLRQRRGSKAGRYYRGRHDSPNVLNSELGGALELDDVVGVEKLRCGRDAR